MLDQLGESLRSWRSIPDLQLIGNYHDDAEYVGALANSVREHWQQHGRTGQLLMSFHGIPQRYVQHGDAYEQQCQRTATLLAAALELNSAEWTHSFQSRFGRSRWLGPATDGLLAQLPGRGVKTLTVICPGFPVDCLETVEEIALEGRAIYLRAGGTQFQYVPALNDRGDHARALARRVLGAGSELCSAVFSSSA